jgi:hypothetical protein
MWQLPLSLSVPDSWAPPPGWPPTAAPSSFSLYQWVPLLGRSHLTATSRSPSLSLRLFSLLVHRPTPLRRARTELWPRAAAAPRVLSALSLGWTPPSPSFLSFPGCPSAFPLFFRAAQRRARPDRTRLELALAATELLAPPTSCPPPHRLPRSTPPCAGPLDPTAVIGAEPPRHFRAPPAGNTVCHQSSLLVPPGAALDRHRARLFAMAIKPHRGDPLNRVASTSALPLVPATPSGVLRPSRLDPAIVLVDQRHPCCHGRPPLLDGASSPAAPVPPSRPGQFGRWAEPAPHGLGPKPQFGTVPDGNLFYISFKYQKIV